MKHRVFVLFLICFMLTSFASGSTSCEQLQNKPDPTSHSMHLPTIGSQKSEYDYLYRTNTAGTGSIEEVSPLPNAFVHPQPQPLR